MPTPAARRRSASTRGAHIGVLGCALLLACGDPGAGPDAGPESSQPASIQLDRPSLTLAEGAMVKLAASVVDERGRTMGADVVTWTVADLFVASVDAAGRVTGEHAGSTRVTATAGRVSASAEVIVEALNESPTVMRMLASLVQYIPASLQNMYDLLPRNQHITSYIQTKIALLQRPGLRGEVIHDRRWVEGSVVSSGGRSIPIGAVFALPEMRAEVTQSVRSIESALPVLEGFMASPFITGDVRMYMGFVIGFTGGGGGIYMEDRATYEQRTPPTRLPYEAGLFHELGHSYIGSESLTQFLELYLYNVTRTGSTELPAWRYTRDWQPNADTNQGVHALLDVYQLIGHDAMARAYRAVYPLRPPYGQPLSPAAQQVFVDQAPEAVKAQVAAKMTRIPA